MPNKLCCPVCKLSDLSYQPNYDNICSPTLDFLIFFLLEREREMYRAKNPWSLLHRIVLGWKVHLGNKIIGSFEEETSPAEQNS